MNQPGQGTVKTRGVTLRLEAIIQGVIDISDETLTTLSEHTQ